MFVIKTIEKTRTLVCSSKNFLLVIKERFAVYFHKYRLVLLGVTTVLTAFQITQSEISVYRHDSLLGFPRIESIFFIRLNI